jgi:hypothetical protein
MIDAGAPSTGGLMAYVACCARPTGGGHGLTTDDPAQRFKDAERSPHPGGESEKRGPGAL